jgi:hypothetical protein
MTPQEVNQRIEDVFHNPQLIKAAFDQGIADAAKQYAQAGRLMASWKDGKVVWIDPVTFAEVETNEALDPRSKTTGG